MLGTTPTCQRAGAARLQLGWGTAIADREGLVCWLDAAPMSKALYEKFGFRAVGRVTVDLGDLDTDCGGGQHTYTCMMREPRRV